MSGADRPGNASGQGTGGQGAGDLRLERVVKTFGAFTAVDDLTLTVPQGSFFALLGPSGCGKTTTLRMIAGLEEPSAGSLHLGDLDITHAKPYRRPVNTVFQNYALFPHLDVFDNVAFGLRRRRVGDVDARVRKALDLVELPHLARRRPTQLSGGQQQRIALARAIVNEPAVLLLDEPLGALDLKLRRQMQIELKRIQTEVGITFVHVTHDQEEAMTMADTVAVMNEGRIEQRGSATDLYERPATAFVASFLGLSNLIDAEYVRRDGPLAEYAAHDRTRILVPADRAREGHVRIGVRPEKLAIVDAVPDGANAIRGRVDVAAYLGVSLQFVVRTAAGDEITIIEQNRGHDAPPGPGQDVTLAWRPEPTFVVAKEDPPHGP